jgi:hypothetical protein
MPTFITFGDSCLKVAGGYSLSLGFWWHLPFPEEVKLQTLLHKRDNADSLLISINVLKFVTVIINYCAALHIVLSTNPTNDPYSVLLNVTDNASALSWTTGACRKSRIGCLLACFFCSLLINLPLGINSQWISTFHNAIANNISRAKTAASEYTHSHPSFDYSSLQQKYLELSHCSFFWPSARANLSHMGDCVDREVAMSRRDKEVESEAAWQSHYIFWCSITGIPDPCGNKIGYQHIVAIYTKFVMCGINDYNKDVF